MTDLLQVLKRGVRAYVNTLENGRDRIKFLGGECDSVEQMEASDPWIREAKAAIEEAERAADQPKLALDLVAHLHRQRAWSERTFGPGTRTAGVIDHIRKELAEIEADPADIMEWIDVTLLALDGAWRTGFSPEQIAEALMAKQTKNEGRAWPDWRTVAPGKAIEHDRTTDQPSTGVDYKALYRELLYAVASKYPGESRHDTALRYIRDREILRDTTPRTADKSSGGMEGK